MTELEKLHAEIRACTVCDLGFPDGVREDGSTGYHVPGEGPANARVMIVGEAPGAEEERTGRPFVGRSGKLLTELLADAGMKREDVFITSIIKCRPPKNRNPRVGEIRTCMPFLVRQIESIRPEVIITVGNFGSQTLLGIKTGIKTLRGDFHKCTVGKHPCVLRPVYHPAYLLRNPRRTPGSPYDEMMRDLRAVNVFLNKK